jgi:hypothetical protein
MLLVVEIDWRRTAVGSFPGSLSLDSFAKPS